MTKTKIDDIISDLLFNYNGSMTAVVGELAIQVVPVSPWKLTMNIMRRHPLRPTQHDIYAIRRAIRRASKATSQPHIEQHPSDSAKGWHWIPLVVRFPVFGLDANARRGC